jgi:hypothetical protein
MSDTDVYAPDGSTRGTTRTNAIRPSPVLRWALLLPLAYFAYRVARHVTDLVAGDDVTSIGLVVDVIVLVPLANIAARLWTTRVWVDRELYEADTRPYYLHVINKVELGHHTTGRLHTPHSLRIKATDPFGPRPSWRLSVVDAEGDRTFTCSAPWVTDLGRLLDILRPIARGNPLLLADEETRSVILGPQTGRRR